MLLMTEQLLGVLVVAITTFIATNLDDLLILIIFFSQANTPKQTQQIIAGQYLGFSLLIAASLPGFLGAAFISKSWIGLLGLLPIIIGLKQFLSDPNEGEVQDFYPSQKSNYLFYFLAKFLHLKIIKVAAVTIANGGDNLGIYLPLFAASDGWKLSVILLVFFSLVGVWCWLAYQLTRQRRVAKLLNRYGHKIAPWVLIAVGIYILVESKSYDLLPWLKLPN